MDLGDANESMEKSWHSDFTDDDAPSFVKVGRGQTFRK